ITKVYWCQIAPILKSIRLWDQVGYTETYTNSPRTSSNGLPTYWLANCSAVSCVCATLGEIIAKHLRRACRHTYYIKHLPLRLLAMTLLVLLPAATRTCVVAADFGGFATDRLYFLAVLIAQARRAVRICL